MKANQDKIHWDKLSRNPNIFDYDYAFLRDRMEVHNEELMRNLYHPDRFTRYLNDGYDILEHEYVSKDNEGVVDAAVGEEVVGVGVGEEVVGVGVGEEVAERKRKEKKGSNNRKSKKQRTR